MQSFKHVRALPNRSLLRLLAVRVSDKRVLDAELLVIIDEVDRRKLYLEEGCASMYVYATEVLRLSESAAYRRIAAARAVRRHPVILEHIQTGALTLSAVSVLAPHLDGDDAAEVIDGARFRSKRQIRQMLADRRPLPSLPLRIQPLGDGRVSLELTVSEAFRAKLEEAQDLMRHQIPDGDVPAVLERGLDVLLTRLRKQRFAEVENPRAQKRTTVRPSRYIPAAVRREVFERDGAQCTFVSKDGRRCTERGFVQLHHINAYARGGASTAENLRVLCAAHNRRDAEGVFGTEYIERAINCSREQSPGDESPAQVEVRRSD